MPYTLTYQVPFKNELLQPCQLNFSKLDGEEPEEVLTYDAMEVKLSYGGDEGKFATIYGMSLEAKIRIGVDDFDFMRYFVAAEKTEWKVDLIVDEKPFFSGFVLADEGAVVFQDKPYSITVTAVDNIGLLKDEPLDESLFTQHHSLISYISSCLSKTGLELPIRVYDNVYHSSMNDRDDDLKWDFVSQAYLEYRTFLKDATTFTDCYNALEIILKENFRVFQWNGQWVLIRLGMLQKVPGDTVYYTLYDFNGDNPLGVEDTDNYAMVGKSNLIFPINENQIKYLKKPVKSTKTYFNYEIWPEVPKNNKFERGSFVEEETAYDESDMDGDNDFTEEIGTLRKYSINAWEWGEFSLADFPNFTMNTGPVDQPLIHKVFNEFELEIVREVSIPASPNADGVIASGIKCELIPVVQGDRIKFSIDKRYAENLADNDNNYSSAAIIYVVPTGGGTPFYLVNSFTDPMIDGLWVEDFTSLTSFVGISIRFGGSDTRRYASVSVESQPIPVTGDLRIILINRSTPDYVLPGFPSPGPAINFYRNFDLEYLPMVAGGFQKVKGDQFTTTQTTAYPDKSEEQVYLSDNQHKIFKGCLLNAAGQPFTPDWYRYSEEESMHYKQITNYNRFNQEHRRMKMIEGTFKTLMYNCENNQEIYYPIGLHKQYRFMDFEGDDIRFVLSAPLEMDIIKCWVESRYYEIYDSQHLYFDGDRPETAEFKYIF